MTDQAMTDQATNEKPAHAVDISALGRDTEQRDLAKEEYEIIRESIVKEFSAAVEEYNFVLELNKTNKKLFEMAKNRAEIFNKRSKLKTEDPIEVIRAKIEFNDRKTNYINSQMDLIIAHYKIKYFLGEI